MIIKCKGCGKEWKGIDEYDAEVKTVTEPCECEEKMANMSLEELKKKAIEESSK